MKRNPVVLVLLFCLVVPSVTWAEESRQSRADLAVANILFDYADVGEFATYGIREDGFVDIIFAVNTPDDLYVEIIDKMRAHPDIKGVLSSKSGPSCKISNWKM